MVIQQYPHVMIVTGVISNSTRNANGDFVQGTTNNEIANVPGRYATSDESGYVATQSGAQIFYDGIYYMPLPVNVIPIGSAVIIKNNGVEIVRNTVKHFHIGQLNAKAWL